MDILGLISTSMMHHDQSVGHIGCASPPRNDFIDGRIDPTRAMERCRHHRADTWESHPNQGWSNSLFCWYFPRQGPCWIRILLELGPFEGWKTWSQSIFQTDQALLHCGSMFAGLSQGSWESFCRWNAHFAETKEVFKSSRQRVVF